MFRSGWVEGSQWRFGGLSYKVQRRRKWVNGIGMHRSNVRVLPSNMERKSEESEYSGVVAILGFLHTVAALHRVPQSRVNTIGKGPLYRLRM